ncbi:unnamed protein product [Mycena citricolor]|uniref:Uncharacterized protein n=1 Tax=Mycena citricolor TaxID=2018698 RepID=A0AAD2HKX0_9AGAR|nr:unnamed protein product [Mycena citricolor]
MCFTRDAIIASCADIIAKRRWSRKAAIPGNSFDLLDSHSNDLGIIPLFRKNGEYPVVSDRAMFMANSTAGRRVTQSVCLSLTHCLRSCVTVLLARSVAPSVSG